MPVPVPMNVGPLLCRTSTLWAEFIFYIVFIYLTIYQNIFHFTQIVAQITNILCLYNCACYLPFSCMVNLMNAQKVCLVWYASNIPVTSTGGRDAYTLFCLIYQALFVLEIYAGK